MKKKNESKIGIAATIFMALMVVAFPLSVNGQVEASSLLYKPPAAPEEEWNKTFGELIMIMSIQSSESTTSIQEKISQRFRLR